jgi:hypothetical protein
MLTFRAMTSSLGTGTATGVVAGAAGLLAIAGELG